VKAIDEEFAKARQDFFKVYMAAKSDEDKQKIVKEKYPKPKDWFPRLYEIATADAKGAGAEAALIWIVTHDSDGKESKKAIEIILRDHIQSPGLAVTADGFAYSTSAAGEEYLKLLEEKSPHKTVKGRALYARAQQKKSLAEYAAALKGADPEHLKDLEESLGSDQASRLRSLDPAQNEKEIEEMLVRVKEKFGDVEAGFGGTLGDRAEGDLFEIRNLAIGKVVPEIEGEDIEGKPLKLSDYRGKVVVIDFWGNW
jgi:hypothetical protein